MIVLVNTHPYERVEFLHIFSLSQNLVCETDLECRSTYFNGYFSGENKTIK